MATTLIATLLVDYELLWLVLLLPISAGLLWKFIKESSPRRSSATYELSGELERPGPLHGFNLQAARPRPYRPFRWKYHQTMALMPLERDYWIELESTYVERIAQRKELYAKHGRVILDANPETELVCKELMFMVIEFLTARYPDQFSFDEETGVFQNFILGGRENVLKVSDPLKFLLDHVTEDFMIVQKNKKSGKYHLDAGVVCCAVGWNLKEKMGKPLHEIHGPVPQYETALKSSMDRYFEKLTTDKPIQRGTWSFEVGQPLFLQTDDPEYHLHKRVNPELRLEDIHLRVDWQTLRRLPRSQAIVFNFKAFFYPATDLRKEPFIPQLAAKVMRETKGHKKEYKGWGTVEHRLMPALDAWAQEQRDLGIVPADWEERTLNAHPFYPNWEKNHYHSSTH